ILLSTIKLLPNAIDLKIYNKNKQAFKMEELVMSKDKTILVQTAEEISTAVQDSLRQENLKLSKNNEIDGYLDSNVDNSEQLSRHLSSQPSTQLAKPSSDEEHPQFTKEHASILSDMLKNGKNNDAIDYLSKFTDEAIATEEIQQTALSDKSMKEDTDKEKKLENEKIKKEELKMSILSQISKLTDILQKMP
ncbi:MAG: hypothetical protein ACK5Z5_07600, partial [Neisseriaceae bacterium]